MGLKVGGTEVVSNSRELKNIASIDSGTVTAFNSALNTDPTKGTLTKTFAQNETADITLSSNVTVGPVVSATKEVPQTGVSTKSNWDVNSTASNYDLHNTAANVTLTPNVAGYNLSVFSYDNKSFNTTRNIQGIDISSDGTRIYYAQNSSYMRQRTLSTAFDISTAGSETYFDATAQDNDPKDITFKPDGTKMYVTGDQYNQVAQYSLSTAWDITTASYDTKFKQVQSEMTDPKSTQFKSDGTKMYVMSGSRIYEYSLSTAWDVTTASYTNNNLVISGQDSSPNGMALQPDGTKMFVVGVTNDKVYQYNFGTAWDLSTLSYNSSTDSFSSTSGQPRGIAFSADGGKLYIGDFTSYYIYQFNTGTAALALGSGSFASTDVGKRIVGNGGDVILTSTAGAFSTTGGSAFNNNSTIAAGSWSMFGLKSAGDADGLTISNLSSGVGDLSNATYEKQSNVGFSYDAHGVSFKSDGTRVYVAMSGINRAYQYDLSTPWDIGTMPNTEGSSINIGADVHDIYMQPDGTAAYLISDQTNTVYRYSLSTAWDLGTASQDSTLSISGSSSGGQGLFFKPDGTRMYIVDDGGNQIDQYNLSTAWSLGSASSVKNVDTNPTSDGSGLTGPLGMTMNNDGTKMFVCGEQDYINEYSLSTAYEVDSATYVRNYDLTSFSGGIIPSGLYMKPDGLKLYVSSQEPNRLYQFSLGQQIQPTGQYHVGVTNNIGRIDSQYFTDINSMTADESAGTGTAHYAVSTDGRTTWSVASGSSGVRQIVRNNSGTWQYNSTTGNPDAWDVSEATYIQDYTPSPNDEPFAIFFKPDGTILYTLERDNGRVVQHSLTTAWDISTTQSYDNIFNVNSQEGTPQGMFFKPDGTKMYITGSGSSRVFEYDLSTAWDTSSASYNNVNKDTGISDPKSLFFKPDGTKFYTVNNNNLVYSYTMSTAWDITSAGSGTTSSNVTTGTSPTENTFRGLFFKSDGTKMYLVGDSADKVFEYDLSTAWDVSTASINSNTLAIPGNPTRSTGLFFDADGERLYTLTDNNDRIRQYSIGTYAFSTSATWVNGTINNEFYTLQEALNLSRANRMDKTQLDAVADDYHFTLGNSLDLMIALRIDAAAATLPTSDGVTLNYNAAVLNEGAVLGTDYDFFHPAANKVQIKSLAAQNLKVRVV